MTCFPYMGKTLGVSTIEMHKASANQKHVAPSQSEQYSPNSSWKPSVWF